MNQNVEGVDEDMASLQAEVNAEKMSGVQVPFTMAQAVPEQQQNAVAPRVK